AESRSRSSCIGLYGGVQRAPSRRRSWQSAAAGRIWPQIVLPVDWWGLSRGSLGSKLAGWSLGVLGDLGGGSCGGFAFRGREQEGGFYEHAQAEMAARGAGCR